MMKRSMAMAFASLMIMTLLAGCITIYKNDEPSGEPKSTETPVADSTEEASSEIEKSSEVYTEASEGGETEPEGGHHIGPEEPPTDESGMRYTYKWLAGLYKSVGQAQEDGFVPGAEILFYENGLYAAEKNVPFSSLTEIGSYRIAGDTIYLRSWFYQGGDVGLNPCLDAAEQVIGINMDGTLIDGGFNELGMVFNKRQDSDVEEFKKWNGVEEILNGAPIMNDFTVNHPEFFNP